MRYQFNLHSHAKAPIWGNPGLANWDKPINWKNWPSMGIMLISEIVSDEAFAPFLMLKQCYDLPSSVDLLYLQLRQLITDQFCPDALCLLEAPELLGSLERL